MRGEILTFLRNEEGSLGRPLTSARIVSGGLWRGGGGTSLGLDSRLGLGRLRLGLRFGSTFTFGGSCLIVGRFGVRFRVESGGIFP